MTIQLIDFLPPYKIEVSSSSTQPGRRRKNGTPRRIQPAGRPLVSNLAQQEQALPSTAQPAPLEQGQVSTTVSTSLGDMRTAKNDIVVADDANAQGEMLFNMICLM